MQNKNPKHELRELLKNQSKSLIPTQTYWAVVKSVDWEEKTMIATGVNNELPFYEVLLGLGGFYRKPKIGTSCLIGIIENQEPFTFLLDCEELDEVIYTSGHSSWTINTKGFIINQSNENLYKVLSDYIVQFGKLADEINKIKVAIGTSPDTPAILKIKQEVNGSIKQRLNTILK